ncbi:MAG: epoxide hydrolase [Halioglobus sp.]
MPHSTDSIVPFKVEIQEQELRSLRTRLENTRWPDRETVNDWSQGMPLAYTQELTEYWAKEYDWRRCENLLNSWPQFVTEINGIDIHFVHRRSSNENALPLIISHGWPDSILGIAKVIDALTEPQNHGGAAEDAFHVIVPSLPGFGFSGKPEAQGTTVGVIGQMWGQLMSRLGYDRYMAQGGDWGSIITQSIAQTESQHCAGIHINLPMAAPTADSMDNLTAFETDALARLNYYQEWGSGYSKQQSTRPQTLGYGLADSPVGQMAWIIEKFAAWTDCEKDGMRYPENLLSKDEMLDNVMIYWLNNTAASSARLYWESFNKPNLDPIEIPVGASVYPHEIMGVSRRWAEARYRNIIHWGEFDRGGHFPALELPETHITELRDCFRSLR